MLLGSDDKDNKLRGAGEAEPKEAPSGYGDTKLFDSSNNNQQIEDGDLVKDSFMLSMKANDPESVSEKLSTASAEAASSAPDLFGDDDELSNFELDSSISAFKPLGDNVPSFAGSSTDTGASNSFAAPKKEEPAKEEAKKENTPLFTDDDPDFKAFAENTNTDPFKAGEDLDFAMSSNAKESDFNTAPAAAAPAPAPAPAPASEPEVKNDPLDDLELDEEALAISPFKPKGEANASVAPAPKEEPKKVEETAKKAEAPAPAPAAKEEPAKEDKKPNMQTYGNVKSGVNAFGKKEDKKPEEKEAPKAAPAKPAHRSPFSAAPGSTPAPAPANQQPVGSGRPGAPTAATTDPAKFRPIPQQQRPQPVVKKTPAPAQRPAASAPQNAVVNQRPGMSDASAKKEPSPFQAPSSRPASSQPKPAPHVQQPISPVTTVNQSKKRGKGPLIIVIVAALAILIVVLGLENWDKLFGDNSVVSPDNTRDTAVSTATELETEASTEETTTTTTEETTTTVEETTEESTETTTEETTAETTEETTEETTATTTEATTAETTASTTAAATGTASFRYSIANPHSNGSQFSFDLVITNTGNADSSFNGSVQSLDITFNVQPEEIEITGISSDYYTFTQDANDPCTFHGTPTTGTVPAGGELSTTITCTTSEPVQHFYITNYHFELR